jgi:hypothetical protein
LCGSTQPSPEHVSSCSTFEAQASCTSVRLSRRHRVGRAGSEPGGHGKSNAAVPGTVWPCTSTRALIGERLGQPAEDAFDAMDLELRSTAVESRVRHVRRREFDHVVRALDGSRDTAKLHACLSGEAGAAPSAAGHT